MSIFEIAQNLPKCHRARREVSELVDKLHAAEWRVSVAIFAVVAIILAFVSYLIFSR